MPDPTTATAARITDTLAALDDPLAVPADPEPIGRSTILPCPLCGSAEAGISVHLWRLGDDNEDALACSDCGAEFSIASVRQFLGKWGKFLRFLASIPSFD